jgi:hypothetical protein
MRSVHYKKNYFFFFFLFTLVFSSCISNRNNDQEPTLLFEEKKIEMLISDSVLDEIQLNIPIQIMVFDTLLLIHDQFEKNDQTFNFMLVDIKSKQKVEVFGREGRGPNEYFFPSFVSRIPNQKEVIGINNRRQFSFNEININNAIQGDSDTISNQINELNVNYSLVAKINEDKLIGTGFFDEGRYAVSDHNGNIVFNGIDYPFRKEFQNISNRDLGMAFQSIFRVHPNENKLVSATQSSANIEIFALEADSIRVLNRIHTNYPFFENQSTGQRLSVSILPENRRGYQDIDVSGSYIYALYSGVRRSEGLSKYRQGDKVLVFNWTGEPVKQLTLDRPVSNIAVSEQDDFLFAITLTDDGEHKLHFYRF